MRGVSRREFNDKEGWSLGSQVIKARTRDNITLFVKLPRHEDERGVPLTASRQMQVSRSFNVLKSRELSIRKLAERCGLAQYHPKAWVEPLVSRHYYGVVCAHTWYT